MHLECARAYQREASRRNRAKNGVQPKVVLQITEEGRECGKCREFKTWSEFYENKANTSTGYDSICKEDRLAVQREPEFAEEKRRKAREAVANQTDEDRAARAAYMKAYRDARPGKNRDDNLKRKFGKTHADYEELLEFQGGCCPICGKEPAEGARHYAWDHDHACCPTSKTCGECIRGLACHGCNPRLEWALEHFAAIQAYMANPPYKQMMAEKEQAEEYRLKAATLPSKEHMDALEERVKPRSAYRFKGDVMSAPHDTPQY